MLRGFLLYGFFIFNVSVFAMNDDDAIYAKTHYLLGGKFDPSILKSNEYTANQKEYFILEARRRNDTENFDGIIPDPAKYGKYLESLGYPEQTINEEKQKLSSDNNQALWKWLDHN